MFKVEVTCGSDPMAQAALNRRAHDPLIEDVFKGRNLDVFDEILHHDFVNHRELFLTKARKGPGGVYGELYADFFSLNATFARRTSGTLGAYRGERRQ
jgi:hypothetical protein